MRRSPLLDRRRRRRRGPGPRRRVHHRCPRHRAPLCTTDRVDPLMIVAQSVPTAGRIPCISSYPAGWKLGTVTSTTAGRRSS